MHNVTKDMEDNMADGKEHIHSYIESRFVDKLMEIDFDDLQKNPSKHQRTGAAAILITEIVDMLEPHKKEIEKEFGPHRSINYILKGIIKDYLGKKEG